MIPIQQISNIIKYLWKDEEKHYSESLFDKESIKDHIFHDLVVLRAWIEKVREIQNE